ncbi:PAS domain S-box-containing protein/diguanylate cyclase (GGDEF) domain-containing protein [Formivibrio citricus]|uniref:PAS domain S-box-containing protein/diguanylate cyclase (GGDEF) domain-containing protein n=1 Tax=Formivibrio citricus TaxID=83765 RepID=A0A1I5D0D6_9NEIS|nr:sensor domain-containing diguanylate cyclase [Formivibrio citricus]SFN92613.1 PAS domain S-box-containing protein/diguanylate cyclase (GGDEF) domain-containing protein [Formivibrio citricus]
MLDFRDRKIRQLFIACVAGFVTLMLVASGYVLERMQRQKIESGLELVSLLAASFEDYLTQSFHNIDLTLRNIPALQESTHPGLDVFTLALRNAPHLRSLSLLDGQGRIYASSNPGNIGKIVDTSHFLPVSDMPGEILRIGRPWSGRDIANGKEISPAHPAEPDELVFLPVMRSVSINRQTFTLLASVNTNYFINHFSKHVHARTGYAELIRIDQTVLLSSNERQKTGASHPDFLLDLEARTSYGTLEHDLDGRPFLTAFHASRNFPFTMHVHLERDRLLAQWNEQLRMMLALIGASVIAVIGISVFVYKRLLRSARIQEAADEQLRLAAQVFKSSAEAIFIATADWHIYSTNRAFTQITGYAASEVIGHSPDLLCADKSESAPGPEWSTVTVNSPWVGEASLRRKSGEIYPAFLTVSCVADESGVVTHYIGVFSDATERKVSERFRFLSEHDFLTGLPNRRLLQDRFDQAIARLQRHGGRLAVLFLDLDHFKSINDTLGHHIGDLLLKMVAERLHDSVRATDTVCRQGGDEFLLLIDEIEDAEDARSVAEKLVRNIGVTYEIEGHSLEVTPSIGIALYPDHGEDASVLIHRADVAMYQSKHHGRNHFRFYHYDMEASHQLAAAGRVAQSDAKTAKQRS